MSNQPNDTRDGDYVFPTAESNGNNPVVSYIVFIISFGLFAAGLYAMGSFPVGHEYVFAAGLGACFLAFLIPWQIIPMFDTKTAR